MNRRKISHLALVLVLVCSVWLPAAIDISKARIGAVTDEQVTEIVETSEEAESDSAIPLDQKPIFFFVEKNVKAQVNETIMIQIESTIPVTEVTVLLPLHAIIEESLLKEGSVSHGEHEGQWVFQQETETTIFELPITFDELGEHILDVVSEGETTSEIIVVVEDEKSGEILSKQEEIKEEELKIEEGAELVSSDLILTGKDMGIKTGLIVEVTTFDQLRLAVANPEVSMISVMNNIIRGGTGIATAIGSLNRDLTINGNGNTITFGADNGSLNLGTLNEGELATLRVVNASITKTGATAIFNAVGTGQGWSVELENITELAANASRIALIPEGKVSFTGGSNVFNRTAVTNIFLQAKDIEISGGAQVTINRGNAYILHSAQAVENPSLKIIEGSSLTITTAGGTANAIDFRGANPLIEVSENSNLSIQTIGTVAASSDTSNNGIILSGINPELSISGNSTVSVRTTLAKRGITLNANNPRMNVIDSNLTVTAATAAAVQVTGENCTFNSSNSTITLITTTGPGIVALGSKANLALQNSIMSVSGQTGIRVRVEGNEAIFDSINTETTLVSTTGSGIYLTGGSNKVILDEASEMNIRNTGNGQNIGIVSNNPSLIIKANSSLTTTSGQGLAVNLLLQGENPTLKIENQSKFDMTTSGTTAAATNTSNLAVSLAGENPSVDVTGDSKLSVNVTANAKRGIYLNGATPSMNVEDSFVDLKGVTAVTMYLLGSSPSIELNNAKLVSESTTGASINLSGEDAILNAKNSTMNLKGTTGTRIFTSGVTASITLNSTNFDSETTTGRSISMTGINNQLSVENESAVNLTSGSGHNIIISGDNPSFFVQGGAKVKLKTGISESIALLGDKPKLSVSGGESTLSSESNATSATILAATIFLGSRDDDTSTGAIIEVTDNANLIVIAGNNSPAMGIRSMGGSFNVTNKANVNLKNGNASAAFLGAASTLRFMSTGSYNFVVDNSEFIIEKTGGTASGVRMFGGENHVTVRNGGKFEVINVGSGAGTDGGGSLGNQGIHYSGGGNNSFTVDGYGSEVMIDARSGPALDMENHSGFVNVINGGYFSASGRTATVAAGIFNAGLLEVDFDNPLFMDFRNNRSGGGNIFNVVSGSSLEAKNSDLAVWRNGSDLTGDPDLNFRNVDYSFSGLNFNTLDFTSNPDYLNTEIFGTTGLTAYSRMSSNNARWAIADELRITTDADKKIFGHVSIPVGLEEVRSAWDNEAEVEVEVEKIDGSQIVYTAKTVGDSIESPGISIYGEEPRGGLFQIDLEDFLQEGDKVRITNVKLTSNELTPGYDNLIRTEIVETFPIVPPIPAQFLSTTIPSNAGVVVGKSTNPDVDVTATLNGTPIDTTNVEVADNGEFELSLSALHLKGDDSIQVFLRDRKGSASESGVINPPETNNMTGNINPESPLYFHDTTFEPATTLIVTDAGLVSPVDPLNPGIEVNPENKPDLPEEQGLLSIDFVSQFNFGTKGISAQGQTYYADSQRLLNEDGTVNETEERPNYVQVSDRRSTDTRGGWELALRQEEQFQTENGKELKGAALQLVNAELVSVQVTAQPNFVQDIQMVVPGTRHRLIGAYGDEGQGTWVYRFGDKMTGSQSVLLNVPKGSNPDTTNYSTTLNWELSLVPKN